MNCGVQYFMHNIIVLLCGKYVNPNRKNIKVKRDKRKNRHFYKIILTQKLGKSEKLFLSLNKRH